MNSRGYTFNLNYSLLGVKKKLCTFLNGYRRKGPKVDASIFDSALSHTRRSEASEKKEKKIACPLLDVFACGQVSSPRLYRLKSKIFRKVSDVFCKAKLLKIRVILFPRIH